MPLTLLKGRNLPENGTGQAAVATLYQYGTDRADRVNLAMDGV